MTECNRVDGRTGAVCLRFLEDHEGLDCVGWDYRSGRMVTWPYLEKVEQ